MKHVSIFLILRAGELGKTCGEQNKSINNTPLAQYQMIAGWLRNAESWLELKANSCKQSQHNKSSLLKEPPNAER
jgi:hypothetical protein